MASITILNSSNVPQGPFTRAEVSDKLNRGEFTLDSLAFVEGLSQWTPLRDVLVKVDGVAPAAPQAAPAPVVATMPIGSGYASTSPGAPQATAAAIGTGYSYAATMQPPAHLVYAGFWLRFVAYFVDSLILCPLWIVAGVLSGVMQASTDDTVKLVFSVLYLLWMVVAIAAAWLYFALQESGTAQATLGKRLLGLQVTDRQGNRIGFLRATGRFFGKIVSAMILDIGFMMAGWTERKQALHDMMADTLVVRKPSA
jgi:uncharacterized RDD family membrane protein YckC